MPRSRDDTPPNLPNYLEKHGSGYRVTVGVPKPLREIVGTTRLRRSLGTDSRKEALRLMGPVVTEFLTIVKDARESLDAPKTPARGTSQSLDELALALRSDLLSARDRGNEHQADAIDDAILVEAERIRGASLDGDDDDVDPERDARASLFVQVARGRETPIESALDLYHKERTDLTPRTKADNARAVARLIQHCEARRLRPTVEQLNRREAGRFVTAIKDYSANPETGATISNKTVNKYLTGLRSLWTWMEKRGLVEDNIWSRQSLPKGRQSREDRERPFTDAEVAKLLSAEPHRASLYPIMLIAALSGARLDAVVSLKVRDVANGVLHFKAQKSEPDARDVPIHSRLKPMIARLADGRAADEDLFALPDGKPEYPDAGTGVARSNTASKAFTYFRRMVGVDDTREGNRRALVNFHSFRRWFITKAHQAGQPEHIVHAVVGHRITGMSFGVYSGGASQEQLRACVEAVQLPEFTPPERWSGLL